MAVKTRTKKIKRANCSIFPFMLPNKLRKEMDKICLRRGIELAEYVRESIIKNNENYDFITKSPY